MANVSSNFFDHQAGQALVEFLAAAAFVLVPVALGSAYLMKLGNGQHEMHEAARYAAWERTVWSTDGSDPHYKSNDVVLNETVARVLGKPGTPIDSSIDGKVVKAESRSFDPMLITNKGDGNRGPIFKEEKGSFHSFSFSDEKPASGKVATALGDIVAYGLDLNDKGLQTSILSWKYDWVSALDFGWAPLKISSSNTLLTESWNAGSPDMVKESIDGLVATKLLKDASIDKALKLLGGLAGFKDFKKLELGKIDVDKVPCHRLAKAKGRLSC